MSNPSLFYRIKRLLPAPLQAGLRRLRRGEKRLRLRTGRRVTRAALRDDLVRLGMESGDLVIVHSALSKLGFVEGGASAVLDALLDALGPEGTLVLPSFPFDTYVSDYLRAHPLFDARSTPSRMGTITELFRTRPGVRRSLHATHPVAALGPAAAGLVHGHETASTTFGEGTPFHRLCTRDGKILLLGVDFHAMTNLHVVEDVFSGFPYRTYSTETFPVVLRDDAGRETQVQARAHDPGLSRLRDCNKMEPFFLEAGVLVCGRVGEAAARLMSARGVLRVMTELAARGITMYFDDQVPVSKRRHPA